ncbi:hypothetical protein RUM44_010592 [Polyplax serrata]|uniref:SRCR domain-containing protein n=1 Tax=Polyplax serrata TaxID=468196 RepID=A0ABR1AVZ0_POLSC
MGSKTPESTGAGHQVIRIDAVQLTPGTDLVLLHLSNTTNQTLSVRPLFLPYVFTSDPERDICVAVGDGTVFLKFVDNCSESNVCYDRMASKPVNCKSQGWIGLIACQSRLGWYPSSPFSEDNGSCGFISKEFSSVQDKLKLIYLQLDKNIQKVPQPLCEGFRCPQGLCISHDKVCDGSVDCPSKADEDIAKCAQPQKNPGCHQTELKCRNGRCVSKNVFGDEIDDCGDGSDEPEERTCLEYLRLTAPQKICNGIRNCYDKSDEDPNLCACDEDKFKCRISNYCLPKDFVCDGERDCPGGEDEEKCFGRRNLYHLNNEAFEIVKNSYGLWHSMCPMTVTTETSDALCRDLGFERASLIYETNQTVLTPQLDPFTWIKLNGLTRVALRSDRPIARLVRATKSCYVVKCV